LRIVIDLQAAQSPGSRHRGIGRYSIALARAMLRHRGGHEILIALNGMFADTIAPLREAFAGLLPAGDIRVWHAAIPPLPVAGAAPHQRHAAELVREAFLASLDADIVHVASMFESGMYAVSGSTRPPRGPRTAVTLYDLIPHIYPDIYLPTPQAALEYKEKIAHLCNADLWLSISESSRQEGLERLGLPRDRVVNISSAADAHFTPAAVPAPREAALREQYGLGRPFVMYTGGIDHRKNIPGLIRAWAALPAAVRASHQLAIVCAVQPKGRAELEQVMQGCGLAAGEVVLPGFVPEDDLVDLYRLCKLFVFPSQHEGFGLPALEAMSCGAPVIGAGNSSIPEVIGRQDALFDALSETSITSKMLECLEDDGLRADLARHGLAQARRFSWDASAQAALAAMERLVAEEQAPVARTSGSRPRLAFVTPMPPQRSGIADSSAELLPELAAHYDIDLVLDQPDFEAPPGDVFRARRSAEWFLEHGREYDRVLYQFGNSAYHEYLFPLLERHPGTVVLHDFYLSGVVAHRELHGAGAPHWSRALYESHGWNALAERVHATAASEVIYRYPANFGVLRHATGVIVHSEYALRLARQWYGPQATDGWALVPLLRTPAGPPRRAAARERLGLPQDAFIVCSFGLLGPIKQNHRLLRAWRSSALASAPGCQLLFVGEPQRSPYGQAFEAELAVHPGNARVTGWTDNDTYNDYLDAADMAVQLRSMSRGETSAAILDCMNHGVPAIANREGSMADLDAGAVYLLPEEFSDAQLARAMVELWRDPNRRDAMSARGRDLVHTLHAPRACAAAYASAIEGFAAKHGGRTHSWLEELARALPQDADDALIAGLSRAIAQNLPPRRPARQLLVDVGGATPSPTDLPPLLQALIAKPAPGWRVEPVYQREYGDWRYARQFTLRALDCPGHLLDDDPVDIWPGDMWFTLPRADAMAAPLPQRAVELALDALQLPAQGDAALVWAVATAAAAERGQRQWFVDVSELVQRDAHSGIQRVVKNYLLELLLAPPPGTRVVPVYAVSQERGYRVARWFLLRLAGISDPQVQGPPIEPQAGDLFFGLDLQPHIVAAQHEYLEELAARGVDLAFMVYDLLPVRLPACFSPGASAHHERWLQVVAKADLAVCISRAVADDLTLWLREHPAADASRPAPAVRAVHLGGDLDHAMPSRGIPADGRPLLDRIRQRPSFLMVGTLEPRKCHAAVLAAFERMWLADEDVALVISGRRGWMVDTLVASLQSHPELGERLFWIENSSDEYLEQVYAASACLVAASLGEGFGLPLVEAAQHGLPIIARDLPVFREVARDHAFYFGDDSPQALATSLSDWLALYREQRHPRSDHMPWQSWRQSAAQLKDVLQKTFGQA
jgi:glycosyltransferase involved in cell wall biosynthesis